MLHAGLAAGALLLALPIATVAAEEQRVTAAVHATVDDTVPVRTYSSPFIAADPDDPDTLVASFVEMRTRRCGLMRSADAGRTWKILDASPALPAYPFCLHTSGGITQGPIAYGRDGTLFFALGGWDSGDGGPRQKVSVLLGRSSNDGTSWQTSIVRDARTLPETEANAPVASLAVDTRTGSRDTVYVAWRQSRPDAKPAAPNQPMIAASTDGGRSFGEPRSAAGTYFETASVRAEALKGLPPPAPAAAGATPATPIPRDDVKNFGGNTPAIEVDGKGTLFAIWTRATANITPAPAESPLYLSRSTDKGKTFTVTEIAPPASTYLNPIVKWSPEGGEAGTLHLVFEAKLPPVQGDRDIYYTRSVDSGTTWEPLRVISDDEPSALRGQFLPNLTVAPNGRVDVAWWDFRNDPGTFVNDVYYTHSTNNGRTWTKSVRVTDTSINRRIGPWSNNFDIRQPPGMVSTKELAVFAWDDTRNGDAVAEAQDIYSAAVQYQALGGGLSKTMKYALAIVAGLAFVGLVLLAVTLGGRRRGQQPPEEQHVGPAPREPVGVS